MPIGRRGFFQVIVGAAVAAAAPFREKTIAEKFDEIARACASAPPCREYVSWVDARFVNWQIEDMSDIPATAVCATRQLGTEGGHSVTFRGLTYPEPIEAVVWFEMTDGRRPLLWRWNQHIVANGHDVEIRFVGVPCVGGTDDTKA